MPTKCKVYSESFRITVVNEIVEGKWKSVAEASRAYGIAGSMTVSRWMDKYGYGHLRNRVTVVMDEKPIDEIKRLRTELKQANDALAKMALKLLFSETEFEVYAEQNGEDAATVKKKLGMSPPIALSTTSPPPRFPLKRKRPPRQPKAKRE